MRTLRDHQSKDLFDPWEYLGPQRRKLLEQSWAGVFRDYLLEHLPVRQGYQVQIMETFEEDDGEDQDESAPRKPDLITHVAVNKLTMRDKNALQPAIDDADGRGVKPQQLFADSHYGQG